MRIFVTGGTGFIGRELKARAESEGHQVFSPDRRSLDLTDSKRLRSTLDKFKPSHIFHLAGISRVNDQLGMPDYFASNTLTTYGLLGALENWEQPLKFFFASSMHVYGNQSQEVDEATPPAPASFYAFTKYLSERLIQQISEKNPAIHFVIGRLYSCFGPSQSAGFVTPDLINKILDLEKKDDSAIQTGPLNTFRRFVDVRDAVRILLKLIRVEQPSACETYNFVSPHELQIGEILNLLLKLTGQKARIESVADTKNVFRGLKVNGSKLFSVIDKGEFRPVEATLKDMIQFEIQRRRVLNAS